VNSFIFKIANVPDTVLTRLETRDVILWIRSLPKTPKATEQIVRFLGLPWRLVVSEWYDDSVFTELRSQDGIENPMVKKRGLVQVLDQDPSRIELPPRCLPILLLNSKAGKSTRSPFENRLIRMTMLEELRRSTGRYLLIIGDDVIEPIPPELSDLWISGFRCLVAVQSVTDDAESKIETWSRHSQAPSVSFINSDSSSVIKDVLSRYYSTYYSDEKRIIRVRDNAGNFSRIDIRELDEIERPILDKYSVIEERDLGLIVAEELNEQEFVSFFRDATGSWRSYAAGLPWIKVEEPAIAMKAHLRRLDSDGAEENAILYIASEAGAGGTTFARALAFEFAREGYPVLLAKILPLALDALPVASRNSVRNRHFS
jgi:hypothetical protein